MLRRSLIALSSKVEAGAASSSAGSGSSTAAGGASRWRPKSKTASADLGGSISVMPPKPRFTVGRDQLHFLMYIVPAGLLYMLYVSPNEPTEEDKHAFLRRNYAGLVQHNQSQHDGFYRHLTNSDADADDKPATDMDGRRRRLDQVHTPVQPAAKGTGAAAGAATAQAVVPAAGGGAAAGQGDTAAAALPEGSGRRRWLPWNWFRR